MTSHQFAPLARSEPPQHSREAHEADGLRAVRLHLTPALSRQISSTTAWAGLNRQPRHVVKARVSPGVFYGASPKRASRHFIRGLSQCRQATLSRNPTRSPSLHLCAPSVVAPIRGHQK